MAKGGRGARAPARSSRSLLAIPGMRERADNPGKPNQIGSCGDWVSARNPIAPNSFCSWPPSMPGLPRAGWGSGWALLQPHKAPNACFALFFQMPGKCLPDPLCKSGANEAFAIYTSLSSLKGGGVCAVHMIYLSALGKMLGLDLRYVLGLPRWVFFNPTSGQKELGNVFGAPLVHRSPTVHRGAGLQSPKG